MEVLLKMKTVSIARVGISARRMRRKALAIEASMPMREKRASWGELWWKWMWKFWGLLDWVREGEREGLEGCYGTSSNFPRLQVWSSPG